MIFVFMSCSQQPPKIINKAVEKCKSVDYGYYEMSKELIFESDTITMSQICTFKKTDDGSKFPLMFNSVTNVIKSVTTNIIPEKLYGEMHFLCNNDHFIWYMTGDSVTGFVPKTMIDIGKAKMLFQKNYAYGIYYPITYPNCYPLSEIIDKSSDSVRLELKKDEIINGKLCHVIKSKHVNPKGKEIEYNFWISKDDYLVLSFIAIYSREDFGVNMTEKYTLTKYDFNTPIDDSDFSIPQHLKLIDCSEEYKN
jgi:hypothetical protein